MPSLPENSPGWLVFAVALIGFGSFIVKFLGETSTTAAKALGPLGRWLRERKDQRRSERERAVTGKDRAFADMERENSRLFSWYEQDQRFHREVSIKASEMGCELPPWVPLSQWQHPSPATPVTPDPPAP